MLSKVASYLALLAVGSFALLGALPPEETCRMKVKNIGSTDSPIYKPSCEGICNAKACAMESITSGGNSSWWCECAGSTPNARCIGTFHYLDGVYSISCGRILCANPCLKAQLPIAGGATVWICSCPDA